MTKSSRHKKLRKQEKAKTQLTGVKKLSKAKNVVEPTLRVKKILIREQLKSSEVLPSTLESRFDDDGTSSQTSARWKQSVQDLIASTNHHNVNIKKDAIIGLQEIASSKSTHLFRNLDRLLGRIASLASDQESIIRKENVKLATMVISMISDDQLTPYWSMLIANLKCTMTHLDSAVRYSALSFIEVLVDHHPLLVYESNSILLPSLLGLISTTHKSNTTTNKIKNVTTLKTEVTGKYDDVKIRIKVLRLLSKCLQIKSTETLNVTKGSTQISVNPSQYLNLQYPGGYCHRVYNENKHQMVNFSSGSYSDRFFSTITVDIYSSNFHDVSVKKSLNAWNDFVISCIPVLIETWVEIVPTVVDKSDQSKKSKRSKNLKQSGFVEIGSDNKDSNAVISRRNGLHILNETHVESMLNITTLLEQLLQTDRIGANAFAGGVRVEEQSQLINAIITTHGNNLKKHFFGLMPYEPLKESRRKDVITINLKLFAIAGNLKMFDNVLKKRLQIFIEDVLGSGVMEEGQCEMILNVIKFLDIQKARNLPTDFVISASKMGHYRVVINFLINLIQPTCSQSQMDKRSLDVLATFQWNEIISELINIWPTGTKQKPVEGVKHLFELMTFIALRRLTDINLVIQSSVQKLKGLVFASERQNIWESAHRAFVYADNEDVFEREFAAFTCKT